MFMSSYINFSSAVFQFFFARTDIQSHTQTDKQTPPKAL